MKNVLIFCMIIFVAASIWSDNSTVDLINSQSFKVNDHLKNWGMPEKKLFKTDGSDTGYQYKSPKYASLIGSIYIYKTEYLENEAEVKAMLNQLLGVALSNQESYSIDFLDIGTKNLNGKDYKAAFAFFQYTISGNKLGSLLSFVQVQNWTILYRISYDNGIFEKIDAEIQELLNAVSIIN